MNYYVVERSLASRDLYLSDDNITRATQKNGINPATVRAVFTDAFGGGPIHLALLAEGNTSIDTVGLDLPDLFYWSWVPGFSERAQILMLELGATLNDFYPCQMDTNPLSNCFLHLPMKTFDVLDVNHSRFKFHIPTKPPIPYELQHLNFKDGGARLPHCFRVDLPGTSQVLGDLLTSETLRDRWVSDGLVGAAFRKISS